MNLAKALRLTIKQSGKTVKEVSYLLNRNPYQVDYMLRKGNAKGNQRIMRELSVVLDIPESSILSLAEQLDKE